MKTNSIRVIAGKYKSRRLKFPSITGLRPTSDQLKETIFNWLSPFIHDSTCIDAFAGSGSLGIEAISRGAKEAIFFEINFKAYNQIKENLTNLAIANYRLYKEDSLKALANIEIKNPNLIIFLDPPFHKNIIQPCLDIIKDNIKIPQNTLIYAELEKTISLELESFDIIKEKKTLTIKLYLLKKK